MRQVCEQNPSRISQGCSTDPTEWNDQYGSYLFQYALRHVRDRHTAQDLVQDTWLAALEARTRFAGRSSERTWLTGILRHKAVDHIRRACHERWTCEADDAEIDDHEQGGRSRRRPFEQPSWMNPTARLDTQELKKALDRCLCGLSTRMKMIFTLHDLEEVPHHEVAQRLGVTENHLYVLLHRARRKIRQCISL